MNDFRKNVYRGDLVRVSMKAYTGISRRWIWSKSKNQYIQPPRGGAYEARRQISGIRATKVFHSLQEARAWINGQSNSESNDGGGYRVRNLIEDWKKYHLVNRRESTQIYYKKLLRLLFPIFDIEVESVNARTIDHWLAELKSPKNRFLFRKTRLSFEKELDCLKCLINWYIDTTDETKLVSPFKKRHAGMARLREANRSRRSYMSEKECQSWFEELKRNGEMWHVLAVTQTLQLLRVSEVSAMKWSNLNLQRREYLVTEHMVWPRVRGGKPRIEPGTKNMAGGKSYVIHLRQQVVDLLKSYNRSATSDLIFNMKGNPLTYRQIQAAYDSAFRRAGLKYSGTHVARHTGATLFLNETNDYLALQQMGNWSDLKMALHYGKVMSTRAKEAVKKADQPRLKVVDAF